MKYTTVGEVIEALQQFPMDTPIVKADPCRPGYFEIILTGKMLFRIELVGHVVDDISNCADAVPYQDAYFRDAPDDYSGFSAVAL